MPFSISQKGISSRQILFNGLIRFVWQEKCGLTELYVLVEMALLLGGLIGRRLTYSQQPAQPTRICY